MKEIPFFYLKIPPPPIKIRVDLNVIKGKDEGGVGSISYIIQDTIPTIVFKNILIYKKLTLTARYSKLLFSDKICVKYFVVLESLKEFAMFTSKVSPQRLF